MASLELILGHDPAALLESAASGFLEAPNRGTELWPSPPHLLALRQGGLRDDLYALALRRKVPGWFDPQLCVFAELPEVLGEPPKNTLGDYERGKRYREHLREEVTLVSRHPDYRAIADREGARRELKFVRFAAAELVAEGAIDLAGPEGDGLVLLDVKTTQCDAEEARVVAENYARQRDVYVAAAEGIAGRNVERFAFQFSRAATQVASAVTSEVRREGRAGIDAAAGKLGSEGKPGLTEYPGECRFCGYRRVGWCEGRLNES